MKLHLPKALLAAVVALGMNGVAYGLTVNIASFADTATTYDTSANFSGNGFSYDVTTGVITYNGGFGIFESLFTLDYDAFSGLTTSTNILTITTTDSITWGIRATTSDTTSDTITGIHDGSEYSADTNKGMDAATLGAYATGDGTNREIKDLSISINAVDTSGNKVGTQLYTSDSKSVYSKSGLRSTVKSIDKVNLNKSLVTSISLYEAASYSVTNADATWTKTYSDASKVYFNGVASEKMDATIINNRQVQVGIGIEGLANAGDLIVGGSGQLFLQTYGNDNGVTSGRDITLSNAIFLGSSTGTQDNAALNIATYSGTVTLNGAITLVENAKIVKEKDKTNNGATGNAVTFNGDVTGNYTLTLESLSSGANDGKFEDVIFAGTVNIGGLVLAESNGSDVVFSNTTSEKTVQLGSLTTKSGAHKLTFDEATTIGSLSMEAGSSLTLAGSGAISITNGGTLVGSIENTGSGNVTWSGQATIDDIAKLESSGNVGYSENNGQDGYISQAEFYLVKGSGDNSSASVSDGDWKLNNAYTITQSADGKSVVVNIDEANPVGAYYVNTEVNYGGENGSSSIVAATTTGITMNGGTLNLNKALADGVAITTFKEGSVINIGSNVTLDSADVVAGGTKSTIAGGNTAVYNMGAMAVTNSNRTPNVAIGEQWLGTVVFASGSTLAGTDFNINHFANGSKSTVEFAGVTGYLGAPGTTGTITANIKFTGEGLTLNNGYGGTTTSFTGDFSGTGKWVLSKDLVQTFDLQGNMSGWTGELKQTTGTYTLKFAAASGKSNTIANSFIAEGGTMKVTIENAAAVSMTGAVTATGGSLQLTKTGDSKLTVSDLSANGGNVVLTGSGNNAIEVTNLSVASGSTVTGTADVTVTGKLDVNRTDGVNLTGQLTLNDGIKVDVTDLLTADTYTYNLASASNGVTVGTYTVTGLGDNYSSYAARVSAVNPNAAAGVATVTDSNSNTNLVLTLELVKLTVTGATGYTDGVLTLTTAEKATGAIFGESLAASVSDDLWAQIMQNYTLDEEYSITFVGADGQTYDFDGADGSYVAPVISFMGEQASQITGDGKIVGTFTIPEPTTATLSLLALAGLAARRRRK